MNPPRPKRCRRCGELGSTARARHARSVHHAGKSAGAVGNSERRRTGWSGSDQCEGVGGSTAVVASHLISARRHRREGWEAARGEYARGIAIVSVLSAEAVLLVLARTDANVGSLLFELRRNRQHISSLV